MKTIVIMRHAKSDWGEPGTADIDRTLTKRGKRDAPAMGRWLREHVGTPDRIVSSPARRARATATRLADEAGYRGSPEVWDFLYPGKVGALVPQLSRFDDAADHLVVVGHNPFCEEIVGVLLGGHGLDVRMTTASMAVMQRDTDSWSTVREGTLTLRALVSPKLLKG